MPDYQNGKIYKITAGDLTYIGSTCEPTLARRLTGHVRGYKMWKKEKATFTSSFPLIETGQYEITLIELFPCGSKDELHARERFHIESTVCVNKNIPSRTMKEWYQANVETIHERNKAYYQANADAISEERKAYREANAETIHERKKAYYQANVETISEERKAYYQANTDEILKQKKAHYQANKDKIKERRREAYAKKKSEV